MVVCKLLLWSGNPGLEPFTFAFVCHGYVYFYNIAIPLFS